MYGGVVDMRKGFDGLSGLVRNSLDRDPLSGEVFSSERTKGPEGNHR
ncbi:IS66 family insertion sequence element accessory protein TnpB [Algoriphagus persicinus]